MNTVFAHIKRKKKRKKNKKKIIFYQKKEKCQYKKWNHLKHNQNCEKLLSHVEQEPWYSYLFTSSQCKDILPLYVNLDAFLTFFLFLQILFVLNPFCISDESIEAPFSFC